MVMFSSWLLDISFFQVCFRNFSFSESSSKMQELKMTNSGVSKMSYLIWNYISSYFGLSKAALFSDLFIFPTKCCLALVIS